MFGCSRRFQNLTNLVANPLPHLSDYHAIELREAHGTADLVEYPIAVLLLGGFAAAQLLVCRLGVRGLLRHDVPIRMSEPSPAKSSFERRRRQQ